MVVILPYIMVNYYGYIIAFSFGKGAYEEAARAKLEKDGLDIKLIRVDELDKYFPTST